MRNVFLFLTVFSAHLATAQTSIDLGDFVKADEVQKASGSKPVLPPTPPPRRPSHPAPQAQPPNVAPPTPEPKETENFLKCSGNRGHATASARVAERMFQQVLGYPAPFQNKLYNRTTRKNFRLYSVAGEDENGRPMPVLKAVAEGYHIDATVCQKDNSSLMVYLTYGLYKFDIEASAINQDAVYLRQTNGDTLGEGEYTRASR